MPARHIAHLFSMFYLAEVPTVLQDAATLI